MVRPGTGMARLVLSAALLLVAVLSVRADEAVITGDVVYRERMLLPAGAEANVRLEDVSLADAKATVLAEVTVPATTSPTPFTLPYPATAIEAGHTYALRASISVGAELMFTTTSHTAFDGTQIDGVELLVQRVAADAATPAIVGSWLAEDIAGGGVIDDLQSTLTIAADGAVTGNSGCNGFGGRATIDGDTVSFGPLAGTMMACAEAVMNQENKFHDALGRTAAYRLDAPTGKLVLLDATGGELMKLSSI